MTMNRALYLAGFGYLAICGAVVFGRWQPSHGAEPVGQVAVRFDGPGQAWFAAMKPYCNAVEVELAQRQHPAPPSLEGQGFSAACYALGGKLDAARTVIDRLEGADRSRAAGIVFDVAHPVADAGDDRSAGPIMELVVDYWPNHYMALYHAGMAEFALGQSALAKQNLRAFLSYYHENDGWTRNARETLARLEVKE
jgi:tetratricopeptide (TPR) repeat protein